MPICWAIKFLITFLKSTSKKLLGTMIRCSFDEFFISIRMSKEKLPPWVFYRPLTWLPKRRRLSSNDCHFWTKYDRKVRFPPCERWEILVFFYFDLNDSNNTNWISKSLNKCFLYKRKREEAFRQGGVGWRRFLLFDRVQYCFWMRLRISIRGRVSPSIRPSACFSIRPSVCPSVCMSRIYFEGQFWMFLSATSHQMASQLLKKMTDASDVPPRYLFSWGLFRHRAYLKIS